MKLLSNYLLVAHLVSADRQIRVGWWRPVNSNCNSTILNHCLSLCKVARRIRPRWLCTQYSTISLKPTHSIGNGIKQFTHYCTLLVYYKYFQFLFQPGSFLNLLRCGLGSPKQNLRGKTALSRQPQVHFTDPPIVSKQQQQQQHRLTVFDPGQPG